MPERRDDQIEAGLRAIARDLDSRSREFDPSEVALRGGHRGRSNGRLLAAAAALLVCVGIGAVVWSANDDEVQTVSNPPPGPTAASITTTTAGSTVDAATVRWNAGMSLENAPDAGVAISTDVDLTKVTLLSFDGAELGSATSPAMEEALTNPDRRTLEIDLADELLAVDPDLASPSDGCDEAAGGGGIRVVLCGGEPQARSEIVMVSPSGTESRVAGAAPGSDGSGHWRWALPSPDGAWVLGQWSGECESPSAFFMRPDGSGAVAVDGNRDVSTASNSTGHGWTPDGRAIVEFGRGDCGPAIDPGVYLVDPDTRERTLVYANDASAALSVTTWVIGPLANDAERVVARAVDELGLEGCCGEPSHGAPTVSAGVVWEGFDVDLYGAVASDDPRIRLPGARPISSAEEVEIDGAPVTLISGVGGEAMLAFTCGERLWAVGGGGLGDDAPAEVLRSLARALIPHLYCTVGPRPGT